jgi:uncharacterized repeat protein (TIGR01451 family)
MSGAGSSGGESSSGESWFGGLFGQTAGTLVAEETPAVAPVKLNQSELDAVASAWAAQPTNLPAVADPQVAPTAYESAANDSGPEPTLAADDRYNTQSTAVDAPSEAADYHAAEVIPAVLPTTPAHDVMPAQDVTRGQAPNDYGDIQEIEPTAAAGEPELAETVESSRRAREAFGDDMAAAAPAAAAAGDRYVGASAPAPESRHSAPVAAGAANPFDSAPVPAAMPEPIAQPSEYRSADVRNAPVHSAAADYGQDASGSPSRFDGGQAGGASPIQSEESGSAAAGTGRPGERALEGEQKPSIVIQKFAPPEIQVQKPAKFAIQVRNVGAQTAQNVVVRDEIPYGTKVVNTTPRATTDGNFLVWDLSALSTGEQRTLEIELMPLAEGEVGSVATVSYTSQASAKTRCTEPKLAIRMTAPNQVMVGQEQRVKIELRNPGSGDATGVMLLENVPDSVKHAAGPALEFEIGTLKAGETRELELVLTAEKPGPVVNALTARADGNLQVQQQVEFEIIAPALQLSVEGPERRYLERPATYQVIIENPGTAPAHDIELVTKLPKGMQFIKANNMGEYDAATHSVYWSLAQLPEGEKGSVELVAMPIEPGDQTIAIEGKAQQGLADEVKREVRVEGLAAIMFEVRDAEDPIEVGGETTYEIRVVNQGSKAATNVQVFVNVPPGLEVISASGESEHEITAGTIKFAPLPQLGAKTDTVYRVQVKGAQPGDQRIVVQVSTDENTPIRREESTRVFGDE